MSDYWLPSRSKPSSCWFGHHHAWIMAVMGGGVFIQTGRTRLLLTVNIFPLNSAEYQQSNPQPLDMISYMNTASGCTLHRGRFDPLSLWECRGFLAPEGQLIYSRSGVYQEWRLVDTRGQGRTVRLGNPITSRCSHGMQKSVCEDAARVEPAFR